MTLKHSILALCAAFCSAIYSFDASAGDTLHVETVVGDLHTTLLPPFKTDSTTLSGKSWDAAEILQNNASLARRTTDQVRRLTRATTLHCGEALPDGSLSALHFTLDVKRFTKTRLEAPRMAKKAFFLDGTEISGELRLRPGRHEVAIIGYHPENSTDTLDLQLTGEHPELITVNADTPRMFDVDINVHGERYGDISISPSGRYVVTHYVNTLRGGETIWRTTLNDLQTGSQLYAGDYHRFTWLPHRDVIYYTRKTAEGLQLIYLHPDTMHEETVAKGLPEGEFQLSPDESFAIITRTNEGPKPKNALKSLYDSDDRMPGWRDRKDQYIYNLASSLLQRLTFGKESCWVSDISPDSRRLLLNVRRHDATRAPMDYTDIFEMDIQTGHVDTVLTDASWISSCEYMPDGSHLLVTGNGGAFDGIGNEVSLGQHPQDFFLTLFLYDLRTGEVRHLLPNFKPNISQTFCNPADGLVYLTCEDGYNRTLWSLNVETLERRRFDLPVSYINRISIAQTRQPRCVFYGQTAQSARNAYTTILSSKLKPYRDVETYGQNIVRGDTVACTELVVRPVAEPFGEISLNSLYPGLQVPQAAEWSFRAQRGDVVKGFYYLPSDFEATQTYPMIVYYYGGCSPTARCLEYSYPIPAMANMGYVTLILEPSGATGFGQEFAARHVNTWGDESGDDIIEGVKRFCEEHSFVDASKVGCIGASYGGFMTQYLQTRTDIFACAISHAGISNITSYWGGGYWGYSYGECAEYGSFPWNNPELFTQHSPLFHADKIHTPLLLLHGTVDTNVPTTESQQMYNALRILGREVSYIQVDGENHIINDYSKRQDWSEAIYAWFAKHLQCDPTWWEDLGY